MVELHPSHNAAPFSNDHSLRAGFVPLRQTSQQAPLFVAQARSDGQIDLVELSKCLGGAMPVYQLGTDGSSVASTREGLAALMVSTILRVQPRGPYRLAGVGASGVLAYEIGLHLLGQDQQVEFIGLVGPQPVMRQDLPMPTASLSTTLFADRAQAGWSAMLPGLNVVALTKTRSRIELRALATALLGLHDKAWQQRRAPELDYNPHIVIQTGRPIAQQGHGRLFCIPGAGDSITGFTSLAGALGPQWTVHGLQPRGVDGLLVPHATVEAAAAMYLDAIESAQRDGPVHLLGHSFGGWIAFQLACQLQAANRPPASLTLIDSEAPAMLMNLGREHTGQEVAQRFIDSLELIADRPLGVPQAALAAADDAGRLQLVYETAVKAGLLSPRARPQTFQGPLRTFGAALRTIYQPSLNCAVPTRLVLVPDKRLSAEEDDRQSRLMVDGWRSLLPQLAHWTGPGNHMTILRSPHVDELVRWWQKDQPLTARQGGVAPNLVI